MAIVTNPKRRNPTFGLLASLLLGMNPTSLSAENGAVVFGDYVTVLTLARDGAWGTATEMSTGRAIAFAIRDCKAMSQRVLGCGAMFTTVSSGWSLAVLCGDETIVAAASRLVDAQRMAIRREIELREVYHRDMPPCVRVATINPDGLAVTPQGQASSHR